MHLRTRTITQVAVAAAGLISITACFTSPVAQPITHVSQETPLRIAGNKVDVLFMVDNSTSMDKMQAELKKRFGDFLQVFDDLSKDGFYTDLHIGVVTSDYGAGPVAQSGCGEEGTGDGGKLQAGAKDGTQCAGPTTHPYIEYTYAAGGGTVNNLPTGKSLSDTFTCIASVGSKGCGFEHQLESVYAALKNNTDNAGFLRNDALLAVVFVTNEDDGSAPKDSGLYDKSHTEYGPFGDFRQVQFSINCGNPPMPLPYAATGVLNDCVAAPGNLNFPVEKYVQLFKNSSQAGGVKVSPADVLLFAIDGPSEPVQVTMDSSSKAHIGHSCVNASDPGFFADPAVRLNTVLKEVDPSSVTASICGEKLSETPDYTSALARLGEEVRRRLPGCIPVPLADGEENGKCVVTQDTPDGTGGFKSEAFPRCTDGGKRPCWDVKPNDRCKNIGEGLSLSVDRGGASAPAGSTLRAACSTKVE
jgi:hypothetical protein